MGVGLHQLKYEINETINYFEIQSIIFNTNYYNVFGYHLYHLSGLSNLEKEIKVKKTVK